MTVAGGRTYRQPSRARSRLLLCMPACLFAKADAFTSMALTLAPRTPASDFQRMQTWVAQLDVQGLPAGWRTAFDAASGYYYYYHERSGQSQWEPPLPHEHHAGASGDHDDYSAPLQQEFLPNEEDEDEDEGKGCERYSRSLSRSIGRRWQRWQQQQAQHQPWQRMMTSRGGTVEGWEALAIADLASDGDWSGLRMFIEQSGVSSAAKQRAKDVLAAHYHGDAWYWLANHAGIREEEVRPSKSIHRQDQEGGAPDLVHHGDGH